MLSTLLSLLLVLAVGANTAGASLSTCEVPKEYTTSPPLIQGEPVGIAVDLTVLDIIEIDSVKEFFTLYYTVDLRWQDERLSAENLGYSLAGCSLEENDIWHSRVGLLNLQSTNIVYFRDLRVDALGEVRDGWRLQTGFPVTGNLLYRWRFAQEIRRFLCHENRCPALRLSKYPASTHN